MRRDTVRTMLIRAATHSDAAAMLAIYTPFVLDTPISFENDVPSEAEFAERIERGQVTNPWIVAERDNRIVGYAYASEFRARAAYAQTRETTVYVAPAAQGAGVGRALMTALLISLRDGGCRLAIAGITVPNTASVGLHERLGFRPVGVFHGVGRKFGKPHDVGFWELPLEDFSAGDT